MDVKREGERVRAEGGPSADWSGGFSAFLPGGDPVRLDLEMSGPTYDSVMGMLTQLGITRADVFCWGLALLQLATFARGTGRRLAVVDAGGRVVQEVLF